MHVDKSIGQFVSKDSRCSKTEEVWRSGPKPRGLALSSLLREAVSLLVEKFDIEFNSDFSAKSPNFRGLVLFCIKADFCTQIRIFQHFSRTTRFAILCTAPISKFEQNIVNLFSDFALKFCKNSLFFNVFSSNFATILIKISRNSAEYSKE